MIGGAQVHSKNGRHYQNQRVGKIARAVRTLAYAGLWLFFPLVGLLALIWFAIRVVPKPSRATYPCQRVAAPLAGTFLISVFSLVGPIALFHKARQLLAQSRFLSALLVLSVGVLAVCALTQTIGEGGANVRFEPSDPPNTPMGVAKGLHPGRVVWIHSPSATLWNGLTGNWWDEENTDQEAVNRMLSGAIQRLAGVSDDAAAWDALFRYSNTIRDRDDTGYQQGEKIAIKLNMNQDNTTIWIPQSGLPSPHVVYSLLDQLIRVAGVPGEAITLYDASRYIGDPIYDRVRGSPDPRLRQVRFVVRPDRARNDREPARHDPHNPVCFADVRVADGTCAYLPQCVTEASYLINLALLRPHHGFGVTLCGKNHFGSVYFADSGEWWPEPLHDYGYRNYPMGRYNCLVDLIGHRHIGGKTLLYLIDGLYPSEHEGGDVIRWESFADHWCSSLLVSQDPVAIDSVALDLIRNEPRATECQGRGVDNYLHEAALADHPPSGSFYDPERDGTRLASLGVHEHWNNPVDREYSRNLGSGEGIELVMVTEDHAREDLTGDGAIDFRDVDAFVQCWLTSLGSAQWNPECDLNGDGQVAFADWAQLSRAWRRQVLVAGEPVSAPVVTWEASLSEDTD
jgi:hypothetical protein